MAPNDPLDSPRMVGRCIARRTERMVHLRVIMAPNEWTVARRPAVVARYRTPTKQISDAQEIRCARMGEFNGARMVGVRGGCGWGPLGAPVAPNGSDSSGDSSR